MKLKLKKEPIIAERWFEIQQFSKLNYKLYIF